ncbi:MAG: DNA-binding protein [Variovorax paradoxus]|uniref:DNA-binding protein n=1 Tax=Variovorax paradoxus TaxID=34073 RepID=A0A2W5Q4J1_VARPD|nr:MAG: DNA-binding protein [Variovorax paradoxus]
MSIRLTRTLGPTPGAEAYPLTTAAFAALIGVKPQTIRKRRSQTGSYFGVKPQKLKNGGLRWPTAGWEALTV